ncbi:MAG: ABC transporter substrate-binding protein [Burkholderiaceae bacterium]|nr:ABC transporter substrate-binding protein [Burkholderiaceae bacterium]
MAERRRLLQGLAGLGLTAAAWHRAPARPLARRQVVDQAGRAVELPGRIERLVTLGSLPVLNSFVIALGAGERLVNGLADFDRPTWRLQRLFAPQIIAGPTLQQPDRQPRLEALLAVRPDLVLTLHRDAADRLAALGLPVLWLRWRDPQDVRACMALLGEVLGRAEAARRWLDRFDAVLRRLQQRLGDVAPAGRPSALYLQPQTLTQPRRIAEWWIAAAGGRSVSDDGRSGESRSFSFEQLLAWDPQVLFVGSRQARDRLRREPAFARLQAVRRDRLAVAPAGLHSWANRTAELPLTLLWAARVLHPARLADLDLAAEAQDFYAQLCGRRLTPPRIGGVLAGPD